MQIIHDIKPAVLHRLRLEILDFIIVYKVRKLFVAISEHDNTI